MGLFRNSALACGSLAVLRSQPRTWFELWAQAHLLCVVLCVAFCPTLWGKKNCCGAVQAIENNKFQSAEPPLLRWVWKGHYIQTSNLFKSNFHFINLKTFLTVKSTYSHNLCVFNYLFFWLWYVAVRCLWHAECLKCSFSFPYPFSPPTAQCFDSQLYRVCEGSGPVRLLPEGRMETRRLHDSCSSKYTTLSSHLIFTVSLMPIGSCLVSVPVNTIKCINCLHSKYKHSTHMTGGFSGIPKGHVFVVHFRWSADTYATLLCCQLSPVITSYSLPLSYPHLSYLCGFLLSVISSLHFKTCRVSVSRWKMLQ